MIANDKRLGYYKVGDQYFSNKIPALIDATKKGIFPEWIFLNDSLNRHDWSRAPGQSLSYFYRQRCQQLREKYDYLTLSYSAGADSENILRFFLDNRIRLDEISVVYAVQRSESLGIDATHTNKSNWHSEWELTIKPRIKWIAENYPEIKITIRDWMQDIVNVDLNDEFMFSRTSMITPYSEMRWHDKKTLDRLARKKGALIFGTDTPRLCIKDGWYHLYFVDNAVHSNLPVIDELTNSVELFYWSSDTIDLMAKQCDELINFFQQSPQLRYILEWPIQSQYINLYRAIMKNVIYRDINYQWFQVDKHSHDIPIDGTDFEEQYLVIKQRAWENLSQAVDHKFLSSWQNSSSVIGLINGMWPLQPVSNP